MGRCACPACSQSLPPSATVENMQAASRTARMLPTRSTWNSWGRLQPVVSGMFRVVAPALMTSASTSYRKVGWDRAARGWGVMEGGWRAVTEEAG
ncbi:hypothetical protein F751_5545 [Auxenochlorella protothecoides]|uniref:Uncharacterized protein n=1 Tax=Auxenochlorella protothecoides TaxID=3075 RepID=A0A087SAT2_AUXPR|nr:hypothetical protein F751_5545 [Auxenochlorella protothecoides]KFM22836.1 hypothetical protein F751_5545 [Auxenochlorella protothecoides]